MSLTTIRPTTCPRRRAQEPALLLAKQAKIGRGLAIKASHATKDAKRQKLLHRIDLLLGGLMKKVDAAAKRGKITPACGTTIDALVSAARSLLPPLTP